MRGRATSALGAIWEPTHSPNPLEAPRGHASPTL